MTMQTLETLKTRLTSRKSTIANVGPGLGGHCIAWLIK